LVEASDNRKNLKETSIAIEFFGKDASFNPAEDTLVRHGKVNSLEEFEAVKRQYPDASAKPTDEPYFPYHSVWSLPSIFSILFAADQKPLLRKSSSITPQTLSEYNIIYVGIIKTLYTLKHTLSKSHFRYEILPHKITYSPSDSSRIQTFTTSLHSSEPNEDLILAVKLPGPAKNSTFIIVFYYSLGAPEVLSSDTIFDV